MTSPRKPVFDAARAAGADFNKPGNVEMMDDTLTALGVPWGSAQKPSPACVDLVKQFEGCKLKAYPDPGTGGDPWTVGWGATGAGIGRGTVWTQEQADRRLAIDLEAFGAGVAALVAGCATSQHQFDALVSFAYNVGVDALANSTLLRKHCARDYAGAAAEFARWNRAGGKVLPGLTRRRAAEAALYRGQG